LRSPRNVANPESGADTSMTQVGLISSSEHLNEEYERPTSKRRASTFAGDELDSITCGKDDESPQAPLTIENLTLVTNENSVSYTSSPAMIVRSPSRSEWTWTWGTLPIKASDPSIADLQSLTDLALREKLSSKSADQFPSNSLLSPLADGKLSVIPSLNQPLTVNGHDEGEYRPVPNEIKMIDQSRHDTAEEIPEQTSFGDLPEPKYPHTPHSQPARVRAHTLSDDYRHTSASPVPRVEGSSLLSSPTSVPYHISARAATIASALGSDRILSLCAHILSSDSSPRSEEDLVAILREHAVSPEEFSINPLDILNNPNLVVVVNNLLIPWRLVHAHLTAVPSTPRLQENLTVPANEKSKLWWAGRTVTNWGIWLHHQDDNKHKSSEIAVGNLSIPSVSRSASVRSNFSNTDGKSESRRESYGNPEEEDFDQYECMSEGSSGGPGPSWSHMITGQPTLEGMDTPGAHLWNKETLNWNSADDFQRLLNEYTTADAVPDLLLPYVNYSNVWPTVDHDETSTQTSANAADEKIPRNLQTIASSRSHDTGLAMIGIQKKKQLSEDNSSTSKAREDKEENPKVNLIASPKLVSISDEKMKSSADVMADEALKEDDGIEFLSLEDISADEILPGPAREVYDGSDTESFYSLNLDDDNCSHSSGSASASASEKKSSTTTTERKYRYRKTLVPSQEQIKSMELVDGMNEINFEVEVKLNLSLSVSVSLSMSLSLSLCLCLSLCLSVSLSTFLSFPRGVK
jgi:hypothetical protein